MSTPWTDINCDPVKDMDKMIEYFKSTTNKYPKQLQIKQNLFEKYLKATGCESKSELEKGFYEKFGERIEIIILK